MIYAFLWAKHTDGVYIVDMYPCETEAQRGQIIGAVMLALGYFGVKRNGFMVNWPEVLERDASCDNSGWGAMEDLLSPEEADSLLARMAERVKNDE